jgi:hypothetical protein
VALKLLYLSTEPALVVRVFVEFTVDLSIEELDPDTSIPELTFRLTVTLPTLSAVLLVKSESCEQEPITTIAAKAAILKINFFIS